MYQKISAARAGSKHQQVTSCLTSLTAALMLMMVVQTPSIAGDERFEKGSDDFTKAKILVATSDGKVSPIVIVSHVDAMPPFTESTTALLNEYRKESAQDKGAKRIEVLVQIGRPNHFTIVEEWADQKSYDAHVSAAHTRKFRTKLQDGLGAPFDERPHTFLETAPSK